MSEYRSLLEKAGDRAKPTPDAFEKLERRRARKQRNRRIATAVFAFAIAIGGSVGAFTAFRDSGKGAAQLGESSTDHFYALWPEQTLADAQRAQQQVDSGDPSLRWRLSAEDVATAFATQQLGWKDVSASVTTMTDPNVLERVVVSTPPPPCPSPPPGTTMSCGPQVATLRLERLVRQDSAGIWSVTEVRSEFPSSENALVLSVGPGDTIFSGTVEGVPIDVPEGLEVQAGYTYLGNCGSSTTFSNVMVENHQVRFAVAGSSFEESCDSNGTSGSGMSSPGDADLNVAIDGYVFVELVRKGAEMADPFVGAIAESPIALAAVPVHFVPANGITPTPSAVTAPDVAQVSCDGTTTQVLTPEVAAQPDGVHISVTNTSSSDLALQFQEVGGDNAPVGTNEVVWPLPPGPVQLRCMDPNADAGTPGGYVQLAVVDPQGFFVPFDLECANGAAVGGFSDYVQGAKGEQGDPVDITKRNATGLLPTDSVEAAGYPRAPERMVRVVRDGNVVANFHYVDDGHGGWLQLSYNACTDAGIG